MAGKYVISKGKDGKEYFVLKAGNGEVIMQSQGYSSRLGCEKGIESVRKNSQNESSFAKKKAKNGRFYWGLNASNGQQIGKSQMYKSESGRNNGIKSVMKNAADAPVIIED